MTIQFTGHRNYSGMGGNLPANVLNPAVFVNVRSSDSSIIPVTRPTLDDFDYVVRVEAENASRHLIIVNGDTQLDGSGACVFDGTGDNLSLGYRLITSGSYTAIFKFKPTVLTIGYIQSQGSTSAGTYDGIQLRSDGKIQLIHNGTGYLSTLDTLAIDTEYICSAVYDHSSGTIKVYIDNVLWVSASGTTTYQGNEFRIGESPTGGTAFRGGMIASKISNTAYSDAVRIANENYMSSNNSCLDSVDEVLALNFEGSAGSTRVIDSANPDNTDDAALIPDISGNENDLDCVDCEYVESSSTFKDLPAISFNGSTSYAGIEPYVSSQPYTYFVVADVTNRAQIQAMCGDFFRTLALDEDGYLVASDSDAAELSTDPISYWGNPVVFANYVNGANSQLWVDGLLVATGDAGIQENADLRWGINRIGVEACQMTSPAILVMDGGEKIQTISMILKTKYGL